MRQSRYDVQKGRPRSGQSHAVSAEAAASRRDPAGADEGEEKLVDRVARKGKSPGKFCRGGTVRAVLQLDECLNGLDLALAEYS